MADQSVLEQITCMRRNALPEQQTGRNETVERGWRPDHLAVPADAPPIPGNKRKPTPNQSTMYRMLYDAGPGGLTVEQWNDQARAEGIGIKRRAELIDNRKALQDMKMVREYAGRWKIDHQSADPIFK